MRNTKLKKAAAILLAGIMTLSMGSSVMADNAVTDAVVEITKNISKPADVYAPNTTFTFTVESGTEVAADATTKQDKIYAGPAGGVTFASGNSTITSTPKEADINKTTVTAGKTTLSIDSDKFTKPGIYRYNVTETAGNYEGITYSTETKYFDVYVNENGVYAYTFVNTSDDKTKDDGIFTNYYGVDEEDDDDDTLHDLTVTKTVTGNQGDKSKYFDFTIKVNGAAGEEYYVTYGSNQTVTLVSGTEKTIKLKNGEQAKITGLSASDTYTVTEASYAADGYTTKIGDTTTNSSTGTISANTTVAFTNDKSVTTPTGVVMEIMPYVLMVAAAAVLAFVFLRKRDYTK